MNRDELAEIQGLYGPITIPESLVQKVWLRGHFRRDNLRLEDGRALVVNDLGKWNLLEGPDFKAARLEFEGEPVEGDVEIHFYSHDWQAHGHEGNPGFANVVLHVVLFAPDPGVAPARTSTGKEIPTLVLLPHLEQDLESYAMEEALLALEKRDHAEVLEPLLRMSLDERRQLLREKASLRWRQKRAMAVERLKQFGLIETCHQTCMEVLGYRRNRTPMLDLAVRYPLQVLATGLFTVGKLIEEEKDHWKLNGLRPANQPKQRLKQYLNLLEVNPDWPEDLLAALRWRPPVADDSTASFRRANKLKALRRALEEEVLASTIGGTRLDTLVCDGFFPLVSLQLERDMFSYWFHWFGGDVPDALREFLRRAEVVDGRNNPFCNGWNQGALQLFIEEGR